MLHAQQRALLQQTNQGIIDIRNFELNYYTNFYATFGGQAALIGGFVYSAVTQATINYGWQDEPFTFGMLQGFWWFFSAICLGASLHCLFTTIMLQVLGPGLALTGPIGSMARATRGLHAEMNQVFNAYILMVVTFAVSVTLSFWIVMLWQASLVCTCVFMYAARQWWFYCSRIYNRFYEPTFYLGERAVHFEERDPFTPFSAKENEKAVDDDKNVAMQNLGGSQDDTRSRSGDSSSVTRIDAQEVENKRFSRYVFGSIFGVVDKVPGMSNLKKAASQVGDAIVNPNGEMKSTQSVVHHATIDPKTTLSSQPMTNPIAAKLYRLKESILTQGYLTRKGIKSDHEKDERLYVVLSKFGLISFYRSKKEFEANPTDSSLIRPLDVSDYRLRIVTSATDEGMLDDSISTAGRGLAAQFLLFEMRLEPKDVASRNRIWTLRCDTNDELETWTDGLTKFTSVIN